MNKGYSHELVWSERIRCVLTLQEIRFCRTLQLNFNRVRSSTVDFYTV